MKEIKNWTKWIYWFTLAVAIVLVYKTIDGFENITMSFGRFLSIIKPFFVAILIAYLFYIPCRFIENLYKKIKILNKFARVLSVLTVYVIAILLIVLLINSIIPAISESVMELANNLPTYYENAISFINDIPEDSIIKKEALQNIISDLEKIDITKFINMENISDYINGLLRCS